MDKRKLIFTSLIVLALVVAALSISYALNVAVTEGTSSEYDLSYTFDISDNATWTINVPAGKTKVYDISVTNPYNDIIKYGVVYKLDNPTSMPKNSTVAVINTTQNPSQGNINANSTLEISVAIVNNSSSNMQVTLAIVNGYKNGGDLIIPSGYALITEEYEIVTNEPNSPDLVQGLIPVVYNGSKWVKADTTVTTQHATCNMLGDVNGDGTIDTLDITRAQRFLSGGNLSATSNPNEFLCADLNADGLITTEDLQLLSSGTGTKVAAGTIGESVSGDVMGTNQWYDYNLKKWANAVLVTSTNRSTYQSASAGTEITESDILAYYVWIPRYKYRVWNISKQAGAESTYAYNAKTEGIDIVFESGKESTGTISCTYNYNVDSANGGVDLSTTTAETCTGNNGDYYTHPAFTFGNDNINGFWISKFEISSSSPTATNGGGNVTNLTVRSLPNVNSWRNIQVSKISTVIQNMQTSSNIYGLNTSRTNTDSHMLTNFEWGAVAYLTNSKYGRCTDGSCTEVTINNCSSYITGIGANTVSASSSSTTCTTAANKYDGTYGKLASTTGNITGVYDMSGGSLEYVMGNISKVTTGYTFYPSSSSFSSSWYTTDTAKYLTTYAYDKTNSTNQTAYNRGRLGDATAETLLAASNSGGWYSDYARFPYSGSAWFLRGGSYSIGSFVGVFNFSISVGSNGGGNSSRASLVSLGA